MGGSLGTIGDALSTKALSETPENIKSEVFNLRMILGIKDKSVPKNLFDLLRERGRLRLSWEEQKRTEKTRKDRKAHEGYNQRLENSDRVVDPPTSPKRSAGEACETYGCPGIVYGNQKYCECCRNKRQQQKQQKKELDRMGTRIYHDDGFWKEAIPNIAKIKKEFFTNTEMAGMVYAKFKNTSFSPSMFWVKKEFETLPSSISPADLEMCRQIHEQFRVTAVTQTKTQPTNNDQTLVDGNGHWTEIEEKILKDIRQVLSAHSLDRVLNWLADLDNSDQSISILQQVQDMLSAKLQEAIEKRKLEQAKEAEKNHLAAVQADLEQKLAEVKAKLK